MNCKNVEPLLSLYVGRDLEEERSRLVATHLQSCTECTVAADEYAGAGQLLQGYEPPVFSDEVYAGIRAQVLNQIEREFHAPVWPRIFSQFFLALVQPRMRWITAALLLAISVAALYLSRNNSHQLPKDHQVAVRTGESNQAGRRADVRSENSNESAGSSSLSNKGQDRLGITRRQMTGKRKANAGVVATNRLRQLDTTTKVNASTSDPMVQRNTDVSRPSSAPAPLRVEIQTSDRNIRIIWLTGQRSPAGGSDGSKGI
jgi:Putative zinc-finger